MSVRLSPFYASSQKAGLRAVVDSVVGFQVLNDTESGDFMQFRRMMHAILSGQSRSNRRRGNRVRANRLEFLEQRALLTGNMQVQLIGGNAFLTGDAGNNSVEIVADASSVVVRGLNGTTINGGTSDFTLSSGSTAFGGSLTAFLGAGNDVLKIGAEISISGNVTVDGGTGNDSIGVVGSAIGGGLTIQGGQGLDTISLQNSSVARNTFIYSSGTATIDVSNSTLGGWLHVHTGAGADDIVLDGTTVNGWALFNTGSGDDDLVIRSSTINDRLDVYAGRGDDVAFFDGAIVTGPAWLWMQQGNDSVQVQGASHFHKRLWHGGLLGRDSIEIIPPAAVGKVKRLGKIGSQVSDALIEGRITHATTGAIAKAMAARAMFNPNLTLVVADESVSESAGAAATTLTVTRSGSTANALEVSLTSSNTARATVPNTATIPAGAVSVTVPITTIDNSVVDPDVVVTFMVAATGFNSGSDVLTVMNDDIAMLSVSAIPSTVSESAGAAAVTFTVSRNTTDLSQPLTVNVNSDQSNRLSVGSSVVIPANATSATFTGAAVNNSTVDGTAIVTVSATATGFTGGQTVVTVTDDDVAALTVTSSVSTIAEDAGNGAVTYTVSRNMADLTQPLTVNLTSNNSSRLSVPESVVIPADAASVTFAGTPVDNSVIDGTVQVIVTAAATGFAAGQVTVSVTDDDTPDLLLTSTLTSVAENAGNNAVAFTVTRDVEDLSQSLDLLVSASPSSRLTVPTQVTIPAGEASVTFFGTPVDDSTYLGDASVIVTVTRAGFNPGQVTVTVVDDEEAPPASLLVSASAGSVSEGAASGAVQLSVTRLNSDLSQPLTVSINLSDESRLSAPATVTIPAGQESVLVDLTPIDNAIIDGSLSVIISVSSTNFESSQTSITVTDNENAAINLILPSTSVSEDVGTISGTITAGVISAADLIVNLQYSNSNVLTGPASVVIPAGQLDVAVDFAVARASTTGLAVVAQILASASGAGEDLVSVTVTDADTLTLTTDISANTFEQSNGTVITRGTVFNIQGMTVPGAMITIDSDGDGQFDEGTTTAAADGTYSIDVTLTHTTVNRGANPIVVKADLGDDSSDAQVNVHLAIGTVVRFQTNLGTWDTELLDDDAPITVQNFLNYVNSPAYDDLIVHRNVQNFVVQAGAFTVSDGRLTAVATNAPIQNEFSAANSNLRGTLSMAQLGGQPNSGTSQWFFNVVNNSGLNTPMHTVFGRVIGTGMSVVDQINTMTPRDLRTLYGSSALGEVPLLQFNPANTQLTGTASLSTGSATLTGTGTLFTTELQTGDSIIVGTRMYFVESIASDTSLTLSAVSPETGSSFNILRDVVPNDADFVVFSEIGRILSLI